MLANIFGPDIVVVGVIIVAVLFGGSKIPKLARSLGSAKTEFEKGLKEGAATSDESDPEAKPNKDA
jgi:sec-independent protein translocase protein TatA